MKRNSSYVMGLLLDPFNLAKPAQVGVDITVNTISTIPDRCYLDSSGKMHFTESEEIPFTEGTVWHLAPGAYAVGFDQGLLAPLRADENGFIIQRSSLNRAGARLVGSIFDPGFVTDNLGATLYVTKTILIAQHARVAQFVVETNESTDKLYNGSYQNKTNY